MECPKCSGRMYPDQPVYFNGTSGEGSCIYEDKVYRCRICGKVVFVDTGVKRARKRFIRGQVITGGYEEL